MIMRGDLMERLRPLVSSNNWDYCVLWKLNDDQRFLEWMNCCCGGYDENFNGNGGGDDQNQEVLYPFSTISPCRDFMFHHPSTTPNCHLLADLPLSIPLDSGVYAQTLVSGQAMWLRVCEEKPNSSTLQEIIFGTRVLIPLPFGLVELFATKQVHEDQQTIEFVTCQCRILQQQQDINSSFCSPIARNETQSNIHPFGQESDQNALQNPFVFHSQATLLENTMQNDLFGELSNGHDIFGNRDSVKRENGNLESLSHCSEDDEEDEKCRMRNGKGPQSKNLEAERKRRKKLNDRLFALRALVPKITKMDKASILGDATQYVKDLQKEVEDLKQELESNSEDEGDRNNGIDGNINIANQTEIMNQNGSQNEYQKVSTPLKLDHGSGTYGHRPRQMEPQVEVMQLEGNELYVKVFCEHRVGGLVRLMEAFNSLGLEVINVTITSFRSLVSNVFRLEMKDNMMIEADNVRDSLLEMTRENYTSFSN